VNKYGILKWVVIALLAVCEMVPAADFYDLKDDFNVSSNPNGAWSYVWNTSPITRSDSHGDDWIEWGYVASHDGSIMQWFSDRDAHDWKSNDIVIHTLSPAYGGGSTYAGVVWTSSDGGYISIVGRAWDAGFGSGRNANWTLTAAGDLMASRNGVFGLYRNDDDAQFSNNVLAGKSLADIPISAGEKVYFLTQTTSTWGHWMGVDMTVIFSTNAIYPFADAGEDQSVYVGQVVSLDGSASTNVVEYHWEILSAPTGSVAILNNPAVSNPSFAPDVAGEYICQLTVVNSGVTSTPDTVSISASWIDYVVQSQHGSPTPPVGVHQYSYGYYLSNSVPSPVSLGITQYVCTGWALSGHDPVFGASNSFAVSLTNNASLIWQWETNYYVTINVTGGGSLSHSSGWYSVGSYLDIFPDLLHGWLITEASGDISGESNPSNISMQVTAPRYIAVTLSDDPDGDGLKNTNEWVYGTDPWNPDSDGDNFDDAWEVWNGWRPLVSDAAALDYILARSSVFGVYTEDALAALNPSELLIAVSNGAVHLYLQLEATSELNPPAWTNAGPPIFWLYDALTNKMFYRVKICE